MTPVTIISMSSVPVPRFVTLSVERFPVSKAASRSGVLGASGASVSTVIVRAEDFSDTLPATSTILA